jgi:hypothetical protein
MPLLVLNESERAALRQWIRHGEPDDTLQRLLRQLDSFLDEQTGRMVLPDHVLEQVRMYAFEFNNRSWQARFVCIFGRELGRTLGRSKPT